MTDQPAFGFPLSQGYGPTDYQAEPSLFGWAHFHNGLDFKAPTGTPVYATQAGTISNAGSDATGIAYGGASNFGNRVIIKLEDGFSTLFGHLSSISVQPGQEVKPGQLLGYTGSSGNSSGPHLHVGLYDPQGQPVNPYSLPTDTGLSNPLTVVQQKLQGGGQATGQAKGQGQAQAQQGPAPTLLASTPFGDITIPGINWTLVILIIIGVVLILIGFTKLGGTKKAIQIGAALTPEGRAAEGIGAIAKEGGITE